jgi:hypothetical protein
MSSTSQPASYYLFLIQLQNSNKTSLAVVDDAFNNLPEDDEEATSWDADSIPSTKVEGCDESLRWLKKAIATQVGK